MQRSKSQKRRNNSKTSPSADNATRSQKKVKTVGAEGEDWFSTEDDSDLNSTVVDIASSQIPPQMPTMASTADINGIHNVHQAATYTYCLPEDDVMRIAVKTKELMMAEIEALVDIKVQAATASYAKDIQVLTKENQQLKEEMASIRSTVDDFTLNAE